MKTINILKTSIKNDLKKINVKLIFKHLKPIKGHYILDSVWPKTYKETDKFIIIVMKLDEHKKIINPIQCQHFGIKYSTKNEVIKIMNKYFKNKFKWSGKQTDQMHIYL